MAKFGVDGLAHLSLDLEEIAKVPETVLDAMLDAGADVLVADIRRSASEMLNGPYSEGAVAASVTKGRKSRTTNGKKIMIGFAGSQHGQPLACIAYVNEYGKKGQNARPFIRLATERSATAVVDAESKVYDEYLKSKNSDRGSWGGM